MEHPRSLCLLGRDHQDYGSVDVYGVADRAAAAMSIGADPSSPSLAFKDDPNVLNEDALCVVADGARTAIVVADAHFGPESSHTLVEDLHARLRQAVPTTADELLLALAAAGTTPETGSETALLVAVHDADSGRGFGWSIGDTSLVVVGPGHDATPHNPRNHRYVSASGDDAEPVPFTFDAGAGDVVLAYTDGIDECHYRNPETSIQSRHIEEIVRAAPESPVRIVEQLSSLALAGVDGNPGGQDNIAVVAICL